MAVDFDKAVGIAKQCWDEVDYCIEYAGAYVFSVKDDMSFGGNGPVAVMKSDGRPINFVAFLYIGAGEPLREGYLKDFA
ncbi:MAG: hypothetical protein Q4A07_10090 [Coriobacteriales bacterium]|nr:hypothetical protein [Coriobacteriales bacterium]